MASLSIVICTYNRANELEKTLASLELVANELHATDQVVVVDNNSCDHTADVIERFDGRLPIDCVFEAQQGLSAARNAAIDKAKNELVVFFDDDVTVLPGALNAYRKAAKSEPNHAFFGGKIRVFWQLGQPKWWKSYDLSMLNGLVGHYQLASKDATYPPERHTPFGANFAIRQTLIQQNGYFDTQLGVNGESIGRGEESDYFDRAMAKGFQGKYLATALVEHRFQQERLNLVYFYRYGVQKGVAAYQPAQSVNGWRYKSVVQLIKGIFQLLKGHRDRFYQCVINVGLYRGLALASSEFRDNMSKVKP